MNTIESIEIKGFKAFPTQFELNLEGKHLLMYGENGSGKSSIYFALHCLYQSSLKPDAGKKYFNILNEDGSENPQHLLNRNRLDEDAEIKVKIKEGVWFYTMDKRGCTPELLGGGRRAHFPLECCFINHNFIFRFFNFRNSETINLFPVFIKDVLSFYISPEYGMHISEMFDALLSHAVPRKGKKKTIFLSLIKAFNEETQRVIENINLTASDRYNKYFKNENDRELQIRLRYDSNAEKRPDDDNEYWLKYDNILEEQIIQGERRVRRSPYKKWNSPFIGLEISEKMDDGTYRSVPKPQTYFNEAKLTAIALSIRFALLNLDKPADGRFLALDDMLISLDMSNRAKVVGFLLDISDKYKIYLFTHDRAFFEFFKHKSKRYISTDEWLYKEIYMGETKSPYLRDGKTYLEEAEHFIQQHKFEIAGNFLRKEAEAFCKYFLSPKWLLKKDYTCLDLNGMIQNCKKYAFESGIADLSLFNELDDYRKFILNSSSHDSYDVVKFESEVRKCLNTLRSLSNVKSETILKFGDNVTFTLRTPTPDIHEYRFDIQICDELRVIEIPGQPNVLSKVMINYYCYEDGVKGIKQSSNQTLKNFYDHNYNKSDKIENPDYLTSIKIVSSGLSLSSLL